MSCGGSHSLFLTSECDVISCGNNRDGQCGFDPLECAETCTPFKVAAFDEVQISSVSAGHNHSLFLSLDGQVFASGSNQDLCIGAGEGFDRTQTPVFIESLSGHQVAQINANHASACITNQGELFLWGRGVWGDTAFPQQIHTISNPVVDISLGRSINVAIDSQGLAWSWGKNANGELGVGDCEQRTHPYPVLSLKGKTITKTLCGHNFAICLGNNIRKETGGNITNPPRPSIAGTNQDGKKKKALKKKRNAETRKRSMPRP